MAKSRSDKKKERKERLNLLKCWVTYMRKYLLNIDGGYLDPSWEFWSSICAQTGAARKIIVRHFFLTISSFFEFLEIFFCYWFILDGDLKEIREGYSNYKLRHTIQENLHSFSRKAVQFSMLVIVLLDHVSFSDKIHFTNPKKDQVLSYGRVLEFGVSYGSVLGLLLVNRHINNLFPFNFNGNIVGFADDENKTDTQSRKKFNTIKNWLSRKLFNVTIQQTHTYRIIASWQSPQF